MSSVIPEGCIFDSYAGYSRSTPCSILTLPTELLAGILTTLPPTKLLHLRLVCRRFADIVTPLAFGESEFRLGFTPRAFRELKGMKEESRKCVTSVMLVSETLSLAGGIDRLNGYMEEDDAMARMMALLPNVTQLKLVKRSFSFRPDLGEALISAEGINTLSVDFLQGFGDSEDAVLIALWETVHALRPLNVLQLHLRGHNPNRTENMVTWRSYFPKRIRVRSLEIFLHADLGEDREEAIGKMIGSCKSCNFKGLSFRFHGSKMNDFRNIFTGLSRVAPTLTEVCLSGSTYTFLAGLTFPKLRRLGFDSIPPPTFNAPALKVLLIDKKDEHKRLRMISNGLTSGFWPQWSATMNEILFVAPSWDIEDPKWKRVKLDLEMWNVRMRFVDSWHAP